MNVHKSAIAWLKKQATSKDIALYQALHKPNCTEKEKQDIEDAIEVIDYLIGKMESVQVGEWYKEPLPAPENAKNTTMEHYRLVCPFCGRRNGKKREKFCADCGAILR
jgi:hypothetical protein